MRVSEGIPDEAQDLAISRAYIQQVAGCLAAPLLNTYLYRERFGILGLFEQATDCSAGDLVGLRDGGQTVAAGAVPEDSNPVDLEWTPSDVPALQPGATHPCPYPFDDEVTFQLGDCPDDDDDGPPERAAGVDALPEADELYIQPVQFVQHFEEVPDGPGYPVRGPHQDHLETTAAGIPKQVIETWSASFRPRDSVGVLGHYLKTPLQSHRAKVMELGLGVLVHGGYAQMKRYSFHKLNLLDRSQNVTQVTRLQVQLE
jgi:hypothetical protein